MTVRSLHEGQTFWCGSWVGGCGRQLTTKLYVDRVCHFAHHPDPDATRPPCARRARDVTSADHLYVKAAAEGLERAADQWATAGVRVAKSDARDRGTLPRWAS